MRQFLVGKDRTVAYIQALEALRALMAVQGSDVVSLAYAEVVADEHREVFAKSRGLKESGGRLCVHRLLGKQCNFEGCQPPAADHDTLWLKDGKPALYLMQPYGLCWEDIKKLAAFCERHGLEARVDTWPSFHFPGAVLSIHVEKSEAR